MARAGEEDLELHYTATVRTHPPPQAAGTVYFAMDVDDVRAALGSWPDRLSEVRPQERAQRRTVQQIVDPVLLPTLDDPAPQMVGQLLNLAQFLDTPSPDPEQVIEVPKILSDDVPMRTQVCEPQLAELLVEVPTIVSFSSLQRIVEQNVDNPIVGSGTGGGLSGFLQGQNYSRLPSRSLTIQFRPSVLVEICKFFPRDSVHRSGLRTRSLTFQFHVEVLKIFLKLFIVQGFRPICRTRQIKGFFLHFSPG